MVLDLKYSDKRIYITSNINIYLTTSWKKEENLLDGACRASNIKV